jgi:hypothetical protein
MSEPAIKHHLADVPNGQAASAAIAVRDLMEHEGWDHLVSSIERLLRHEQTLVMTTVPQDELKTQRQIGRWAGLREIQAIARGIVERGREAEDLLREGDR